MPSEGPGRPLQKLQKRRWRVLAAVFALVLVAAACGGDDDDGGDAGGGGGGDGAPAATAGFDGTTIKLGVITPTSGPVAVIGNPLTAGNQAFFDSINANGGIAGQYPVELVIQDSAYDVPKAGTAYEAIKGQVVMFAQLLGTPIVQSLLPQLNTDQILAAPASLDAEWVRQQYLLPVGAPYQIQAANALTYYVEQGGGEGKRVCSLRVDSPYGEAGQEGLNEAAEVLGITLGAEVTFPATATDYTTQIGQLQSDGCEMVFLISTPSQTGGALGKAAELGFAPQWYGQSPTWIGALASSPLAPYLQANFLLVSEGTFYGDTTVEGMAELVRVKDTYAPNQAPDIYFNFGYLQGLAIEQVLEKAVEMGDLSRQGLIEAMNSIDVMSYDGLTGDYAWGSPEDRNPPRTSSIFKVDSTKPYGLDLVAANIESEAADNITFE